MKEKLQAIVNKLILLKIFISSVLKLYPMVTTEDIIHLNILIGL